MYLLNFHYLNKKFEKCDVYNMMNFYILFIILINNNFLKFFLIYSSIY